jgi:Na+/proline symporter
LQRFVFDYFNIPFAFTVFLSLLLIFSYTYRGGLKTIIITDTLQTFFLVTSVFLTIYFICDRMDLSAIGAFEQVKNSNYSKIFFFEDFLGSKFHFVKQIIGGMFVTIAMTGLDQDLMQKNLSCKNIGEAQKNMFTFTGIFVIINIFFLSVGALLYIYANKNGIAIPTDFITGKPRTDFLFPEIALNHLATIPAIVFLLGIIAATFATTDSALTALTTSFCVDFLGMDKAENTKKNTVRTRHLVHISFSILIFFVIIIFNTINDSSVVGMIFRVASYTYGPLLGLYAFGLFQKSRNVKDRLVPIICLLSPFFTYLIYENSQVLFSGYVFDNELIVINGLLTYLGLFATSSKSTTKISF